MSNVQKKGASGFIFLLLPSRSYHASHLTTPHLLPYDKLQIREQNEKVRKEKTEEEKESRNSSTNPRRREGGMKIAVDGHTEKEQQYNGLNTSESTAKPRNRIVFHAWLGIKATLRPRQASLLPLDWPFTE
ncbi:hypothetical protein C0Q70_16123 [Pomacea canaliculata]|uniref:Uncharacterized protein n=1 Tax=Pomacea canaliculata TaxID=400727 RepID=A0A2T7NNX1_POMCA|nr:hypothetical protein C0Q70_16123 [Pomacea canaliculata]